MMMKRDVSPFLSPSSDRVKSMGQLKIIRLFDGYDLHLRDQARIFKSPRPACRSSLFHPERRAGARHWLVFPTMARQLGSDSPRTYGYQRNNKSNKRVRHEFSVKSPPSVPFQPFSSGNPRHCLLSSLSMDQRQAHLLYANSIQGRRKPDFHLVFSILEFRILTLAQLCRYYYQ